MSIVREHAREDASVRSRYISLLYCVIDQFAFSTLVFKKILTFFLHNLDSSRFATGWWFGEPGLGDQTRLPVCWKIRLSVPFLGMDTYTLLYLHIGREKWRHSSSPASLSRCSGDIILVKFLQISD